MTLAIGTEKGGFLLDHTAAGWTVRPPLFPGWKVTAFGRAPSGEYLLAVGSNWFGAAIHRSRDLSTWDQVIAGPSYEGLDRPLTQIWTLATQGTRIYAGVDEAGLFRSDDDGVTWQPVTGLNEHETRPGWVPGLGGLAAHRILTDPGNDDRIWCAISAVGLFRSDNGGETWDTKNHGIRQGLEIEDFDGIGFCVHSVTLDPDNPDHLWRQEHTGVFRSTDGGDSWEPIEKGLPAVFGMIMTRDHASGRLFVIPLESDERRLPVDGRFGVYRSDDNGDTWMPSGTGWPQEPTYTSVLRGAMTADQTGGIFLGTTGGQVWASADLGETWERLPLVVPRILTVAVFTD
ncbi:MAG: exo-alpha-sialidase [Acidimicrobiia bacterium]|nr:exo-alpha-sialidase [Acidimicrobiia bacterium]